MLKNLLKTGGVLLGILFVGGIGYSYYQKNNLHNEESTKVNNLLKKRRLNAKEIEDLENYRTPYKYLSRCISVVEKVNNGQNLSEKDFHYLYRVIHRFFTWKLTVALSIILNSHHIQDSRLLNLFMDFKFLLSPVSRFLKKIQNNADKLHNGSDFLDEQELKNYIDVDYKCRK